MTRTDASSPAAPEPALRRALRRVSGRMRLQRALTALCTASAMLLWVLIGAELGAWLSLWPPFVRAGELGTLAWPVALVALVAGVSAARAIPAPVLARALDAVHARDDLFSSAVSFEQLPGAAQTPFMRACIEQAARAAPGVSARAAAPLTRPASLPALCASLALVLAFSHRSAQMPEGDSRTAQAPRVPVLPHETLRAFADELRPLREQADAPLARDLVDRFNSLLEGLATGELSRTDALSELRRLEQRLDAQHALDPAVLDALLDQAFAALGKALAGTPEATELEKSLRERWQSADQALEKLGERIAEQKLSDKARARLADRLQRAAKTSATSEQQAALAEAKRELDRLLKRESEQTGKRAEQDQRLLKRKQRELERLEREQAQSAQVERELERLKRELDAAARALQRDDAKGAQEAAQQAAQALRDAAQREQARKREEQLREQVAQLRAELAERRADRAQAGQSFGDHAGEGDPQPTPLRLERFGRVASGRHATDASGQGAAEHQAGAQPGLRAGEGARGEGNAPDERGSLTRRSSLDMAQAGEEQSTGAGEGGTPQRGASTRTTAEHVDTRLQGERSAGPSRAEVILESGQRGFATERYARVHADYDKHAESVIERERIPSGYRSYVRRYFQLIRPRSERAPLP